MELHTESPLVSIMSKQKYISLDGELPPQILQALRAAKNAEEVENILAHVDLIGCTIEVFPNFTGLSKGPSWTYPRDLKPFEDNKCGERLQIEIGTLNYIGNLEDLLIKYKLQNGLLVFDGETHTRHYVCSRTYPDNGLNHIIIKGIDPRHNDPTGLACECSRTTSFWASIAATSITQAYTDPLTGIYNRAGLDLHFEEILEHFRVNDHDNSTNVLAVFCIDLDKFKTINDTFGHAVGDIVIKRVALILKNLTHGRGFAARNGGDEFTCALVCNSREDVDEVAEKIKSDLNELQEELNKTYPCIKITASIGVCVAEKHEIEAWLNADQKDGLPHNRTLLFEALRSHLMSIADKASYEVKNRGRNGHLIFTFIEGPQREEGNRSHQFILVF